MLAAGQAFYSVVVPPETVKLEWRKVGPRLDVVYNDKTVVPSMTGYSSTPTKSDFPVVGMPPSVPVTPRALTTNRNAPSEKAGEVEEERASFDRGNAPDIDNADK